VKKPFVVNHPSTRQPKKRRLVYIVESSTRATRLSVVPNVSKPIKGRLDNKPSLMYIDCIERRFKMFGKDVPLSECCGALPAWGIHNGDGICRDCKEHSEFTDEDGNVVQDW
jgi:hypothetical protein